MLPTIAKIIAAPACLDQFYEDKFSFWDDVEGFDFSFLGGISMAKSLEQPQLECIEESQQLSDSVEVVSIDCRTITIDQIQEITKSIDFSIQKDGTIHAISLWFDVTFLGTNNVVLSTSPSAPPTHWKQTLVLLPQPLPLEIGDNLSTTINLTVSPDHPRRYLLKIHIGNGEENQEDDDEMVTDQDMYNKLLEACMKNSENDNEMNETESKQ